MTVEIGPCVVCHEVTTAFNYGLQLCNSCKSFLSRTKLSKRIRPCSADRECYSDEKDLTAMKKPSCRDCRYSKILRLIEEAAEKSSSSSNSNSPSPSSLPSTPSPVSFQELSKKMSSELNHLIEMNETRKLLSKTMDVVGDPSYLDVVLNHISYLTPKSPTTEQIGSLWCSSGILAVAESVKCFKFYDSLLLSDKNVFLKRGVLKSFNLSSAFDFLVNPSSPSTDKAVFSKLAHENEKFRDSVKKYLSAIFEPLLELRIQENEYLLLNAILLCNPGHSGLSPSARTILTEEQSKYGELLFALCTTQNPQKGYLRFAEIMSLEHKLDSQMRLTKKIVDIVQEDSCFHHTPKVVEEACKPYVSLF